MSPSSPPRPARPLPGSGEGGFVLLEILMALVIFATLVLSYARATDNALEAARQANADRTLRLLCSRKLSEVRAKPAGFVDGGEGGFEEEVDPGQSNPFIDYRWKVEAQEVVAAGYTGDQNTVFLFDQDGTAPTTPATGDNSKAPDPVKLLRLVLTVSHEPEGSDSVDQMRVVTFVQTLPKDSTPGGGH